MQQILLINDHTEAAAQAARTALTLAKTTNANLVLATVTATPQIKKGNRELVTNLPANVELSDGLMGSPDCFRMERV